MLPLHTEPSLETTEALSTEAASSSPTCKLFSKLPTTQTILTDMNFSEEPLKYIIYQKNNPLVIGDIDLQTYNYFIK